MRNWRTVRPLSLLASVGDAQPAADGSKHPVNRLDGGSIRRQEHGQLLGVGGWEFQDLAVPAQLTDHGQGPPQCASARQPVPVQATGELLPGPGAEVGSKCGRVVVGRAARKREDLLVGHQVPVREHTPGAGVGEHEPGQIRPVPVEQPGETGDRVEPARVSEQIAEPVTDQRNARLETIEQPPRARPDLPAGLDPGLTELTTRLAAADAFILVTPEYNHSYPASLKAAIDWHFTQWTAKPVAFVSYGGAAGGRHAVLHLENVLTELHAVTIRDGLAFPNYYVNWTDGHPTDPKATGYAKTLLDQLAWWAATLRTARTERPYPEG